MNWLLDLVPWWAWLLLGTVAVGTVWRLLGWQGALVAVAGLLAALGYGKGSADASGKAQSRIDRRNAEATKHRKDIDDEVDQMGSTDLDSNYSRWLRDDDPR